MGTWRLLTEGETDLGVERTERRRVPGGWLYRTSVTALRPAEDEPFGARVAAKMVFVPGPRRKGPEAGSGEALASGLVGGRSSPRRA